MLSYYYVRVKRSDVTPNYAFCTLVSKAVQPLSIIHL